MQLLLIRHGKMAGDPYTKPGRGVEGSLSAEGIAQATALADALRNVRIDEAICSSYGRAVQTAELALAGRDVPLHILDEIHEWLPEEGLQRLATTEYEAMHAQHADRYAEETWKTDLGEGTYDMYARIVPPFLRQLAALGVHARHGGFVMENGADERTFAVFAHGGSLNILLSHLLGVIPFPVGRFAFGLTGLARITFQRKASVWYPMLRIDAPHSNGQ